MNNDEMREALLAEAAGIQARFKNTTDKTERQRLAAKYHQIDIELEMLKATINREGTPEKRNEHDAGRAIDTGGSPAPTPHVGAQLIANRSAVAASVVRIALGVVCVFGAVFYFAVMQSPSGTKPSAGLALPSIGVQIVTFDKYQSINTGQSYQQVKSIIGAEGEELSSNSIEGIPGVMPATKTVMYQWVNSNGSNMNAMFQNDKLIQKAQFGLR